MPESQETNQEKDNKNAGVFTKEQVEDAVKKALEEYAKSNEIKKASAKKEKELTDKIAEYENKLKEIEEENKKIKESTMSDRQKEEEFKLKDVELLKLKTKYEEMEKNNFSIEGKLKEVEEKASKELSQYKISLFKEKAIRESGISGPFVNLINGSNEEEITSSIKTVLEAQEQYNTTLKDGLVKELGSHLPKPIAPSGSASNSQTVEDAIPMENMLNMAQDKFQELMEKRFKQAEEKLSKRR